MGLFGDLPVEVRSVAQFGGTAATAADCLKERLVCDVQFLFFRLRLWFGGCGLLCHGIEFTMLAIGMQASSFSVAELQAWW
jgi:hypothetical protein